VGYTREQYLAWAHTTSGFDLDCSKDHTVVTLCALSLRHLAFGTQLLEDHLSVSAFVGIGVVETHYKAAFGATLVMTVKLLEMALGMVDLK
jgi:hypothetical protein